MIKERILVCIATFFIIGSVLFQFKNVQILDTLFTMTSLIIMALVPFWVNIKKKLLPFIFLLFIIYGYVLYRTFDSNVVNVGTILFVFLFKGVILTILLGKFKNDEMWRILLVLTDVFMCFTILNLIQILFFSALLGLNNESLEIYLLAVNYNSLGGILIVGILSSYILMFVNRKYSLKFWILIIISLITVLIVGSLTSIIGLLFVFIYALFYKICIVRKCAFWGVIVLILGILFSIIIFTGTGVESSDIIASFVTMTGKDLSFSGRTYIWKYALDKISDNPYWGVGYYQLSDWATCSIKAVHAHNILLDIVLCGGVCLLLVIVLCIIKTFKKIKHVISKHVYEGILFITLVYLLMMQFEVYNYFILFVFFFIIYCSRFIPQLRKRK